MADTLTTLFRRLAEQRPHAPAVTLGDRTSSYAELEQRSGRVSAALAAAGVGPQDRVAVLDKNAPTFYEIVLGAARIGAVTVGLNHRFAAPELAEIVTDARPAVIVVGPEFAGLLPPGGPCVVTLGPAYEAWLAAAPAAVPDHHPDPDAVVLQLYSSGTTGRPKGAMLTSANLLWTARMGREYYGMDADSVNLVPSPLFHIGGVGYSLTALGQGGHTILVRDVDPPALLDLIERHRVTHAFLVPSVVQMLAESPSLPATDLSSLRLVAYGAAPMSETLLVRAMALFGCDFLGVYGMTETAGSVTALRPADHDPGGPRACLLRSVGRPMPWLELRVVDPATGRDAPVGGVGEIWVRSGQNTVGYWGQPELTGQTLLDGGWLRTGDAAYLDAAGYVHLHDRMKDMIVSGGENVYPAEVENVLCAHPGVLEAAVIGVPSDRWGETVRAVVVPRPAATLEAAELIGFARQRLAHYKCPASVGFVAALPRNASGKVLKKVLREPFWAGTDRSLQG